MKRKSYLIIALVLAVIMSGGLFAYTYTMASATLTPEATKAEFATCEPAPDEDQPPWASILTPVADTEILRPNATGTYSQCDARGDSPNYRCVDEEATDEDATHVRTRWGATEIDTYNIPDHSEGVGTITSVTVYIRSRGTNTTNLHAAETVIRTNGTNRFGTYTLLPLSYTDFFTTYPTNPVTLIAWTWAEIDALEAGVRQHDNGSGEVRTTQVYVKVSYAAIPLCGDVPIGDLFKVTPEATYTGDLLVKVYLTNVAALTKAYQYLNMKLYLEGSVEAGETPDYRLLTLENGVATFNLKDYAPGGTYTLSIPLPSGGSYCLVSRDTTQWETGWTVEPEFYCEVTQSG